VRSIEYQGWQYFITLDELWFYLSTDCEIIWLPDGESPSERERHMIQATNGVHNHMESSLVSRCRHLSKKYLMRCTISNIFWNKFCVCVQNMAGVVSSIKQTMPGLIRPGGFKYFLIQILSELRHILSIFQISHHHISIYLNIRSIVWREIHILRKKHFISEFIKFWGNLTDHFAGRVQELDG
jgi:hypothetical protein